MEKGSIMMLASRDRIQAERLHKDEPDESGLGGILLFWLEQGLPAEGNMRILSSKIKAETTGITQSPGIWGWWVCRRDAEELGMLALLKGGEGGPGLSEVSRIALSASAGTLHGGSEAKQLEIIFIAN